MVTEPRLSSPNQPNQERTTVYPDSSGPNSRSDTDSVTIVGDWEKLSGESLLNTRRIVTRMAETLPGRGSGSATGVSRARFRRWPDAPHRIIGSLMAVRAIY